MPSNKVYDVSFYSDCNSDDVIRKDLEEQFYSGSVLYNSFDIKPFSLSKQDDYIRIINNLEYYLNNSMCDIHISNFCIQHVEPPQYEVIDNVAHIIELIIAKISNSKFKHNVELHLKCYDYDNVFESKYYHNTVGYVKTVFETLKDIENINQIEIFESSYNLEMTTEQERNIVTFVRAKDN